MRKKKGAAERSFIVYDPLSFPFAGDSQMFYCFLVRALAMPMTAP